MGSGGCYILFFRYSVDTNVQETTDNDSIEEYHYVEKYYLGHLTHPLEKSLTNHHNYGDTGVSVATTDTVSPETVMVIVTAEKVDVFVSRGKVT